MSDFFEGFLWYFVLGIIAILLLFVGILEPKFEAEAYERLTGKHVTYWDAVWLDLRIQEQIK